MDGQLIPVIALIVVFFVLGALKGREAQVMDDYQRYQRKLRRQTLAYAALAWFLVILGGVFLAFAGWLALVGFVTVFG